MKYTFQKELIEGVIKSRPNRFIMNVDINGKNEICHCPSTGRIGNLKFENIPCLLSESNNEKRKTKFTVEAFSLDSSNEANKKWIGINQTKANEYIEFFLKNNMLKEMINAEYIKRELQFRNSRFDFLINENTFMEVKTPLKDIDCSKHQNYKKSLSKFNSFERIIKHFTDISKASGKRTIFLLCNIYDAPEFKVPIPEKAEKRIVQAAKDAHDKGLENWQINLKLDKEGISLIKLFKLDLFKTHPI